MGALKNFPIETLIKPRRNSFFGLEGELSECLLILLVELGCLCPYFSMALKNLGQRHFHDQDACGAVNWGSEGEPLQLLPHPGQIVW
jgi:hypothetical protein